MTVIDITISLVPILSLINKLYQTKLFVLIAVARKHLHETFCPITGVLPERRWPQVGVCMSSHTCQPHCESPSTSSWTCSMTPAGQTPRYWLACQLAVECRRPSSDVCHQPAPWWRHCAATHRPQQRFCMIHPVQSSQQIHFLSVSQSLKIIHVWITLDNCRTLQVVVMLFCISFLNVSRFFHSCLSLSKFCLWNASI